MVAEWLANGKFVAPADPTEEAMSVNELLLAYWRFAEGYYVKNGEPTAMQVGAMPKQRLSDWISQSI